MGNSKTISRLITTGALMFLIAKSGMGQDFVNTRKISLHRGDTMVIAGILADVKIEGIDPKVYYYWYDNGRIYSNQGGHGGNLLHGEYVEYAPEGSLILKGNYHKGTQSGKWNYWYASGALKESIQYMHGFLEGIRIRYSPQGKIYFQAHYRQNQLHGKMITVISDSLYQIKYRKGEEINKELLHVFDDQE